MNSWLKTLRRVFYWILPPIIFYLIFRKVDFVRLKELAETANIWLILFSVLPIGLVTLLGGLRWHFLIRQFDCASLPLALSLGEFWKSLAVGVFVPGSLGSDAYRVMVPGRQKGYFLRSAFVIGVEKLAALFSCAVLIGGLYPLLAPNHLPRAVTQVIDVLYVFFLAGIPLSIIVTLVRRKSWGRFLAAALNTRLAALARRVAALNPTQPPREEKSPRTALALMLSAFSPKVALPSVALSLAIYLISAAQIQLYFQALNYDIPFSVNLFIAPLLFLLFSLPISLGSIGIREGAYILMYGAFGVPAETALVVSFCGLLSILVNYAVGACLLWVSKEGKASKV